jgi:hypothetical protein
MGRRANAETDDRQVFETWQRSTIAIARVSFIESSQRLTPNHGSFSFFLRHSKNKPSQTDSLRKGDTVITDRYLVLYPIELLFSEAPMHVSAGNRNEMRYRGIWCVLALLLQHSRLAYSFERSSNQRFPAMSRWGRSFGLGNISPSRKDQESVETTNNNDDEGRRSFILGSAAALGSAIWSRQQPAQASTVILEESEARRIDIFERNSPSVVFIDTFTEKQDAFSPNVMEVPLGSGSGFVWDNKGHIGTSEREFLHGMLSRR